MDLKRALKRKNITNDLDNTAPSKQLLEELPYKNKEAFVFCCQNLRQRSTLLKHWLLQSYPLNTFDEDWDGQLLSNYFESFKFKSLPPHIITPVRHIGKNDPIVDYIKKKFEWKEQILTHKKSICRYKHDEKLETLNDDVVSCPKAIIKLAKLMEEDPEPYIDSRYNWYYAGFGILHLIALCGKQYLLYSEFNSLYLKQFNKEEIKIVSQEPVTTFDCNADNNILEIVFSNDIIPIIALRTRLIVYILKIVFHEDAIKFEEITSLDSDIPFVGISFDSFNKQVLNVTLVDGNFFIINVETLLAKKITPKSKKSGLVDNWNIIVATKRTYYTHVTSKTISVYDKRTNKQEHLYNNVEKIVDQVTCNNITVARQFNAYDYLYFGTNHHLFVLDLRFVMQYQLQAIQRWSHGMEFPPIYMDKCDMGGNKDLLCLSSQWCEDMCVVPDYRKGQFVISSSHGVCMPYRPPSIFSVLHEAREQTLCDLNNPLDKRLATATCGSIIFGHDNRFNILTLNSLGDITHHHLFPEEKEYIMEDNSVENLVEWSKFYKFTKPMEVTAIVDIAKVWKKLIKVPEDRELIRDAEDERFNEAEINETFEKEEIDVELKEVWADALESEGQKEM